MRTQRVRNWTEGSALAEAVLPTLGRKSRIRGASRKGAAKGKVRVALLALTWRGQSTSPPCCQGSQGRRSTAETNAGKKIATNSCFSKPLSSHLNFGNKPSEQMTVKTRSQLNDTQRRSHPFPNASQPAGSGEAQHPSLQFSLLHRPASYSPTAHYPLQENPNRLHCTAAQSTPIIMLAFPMNICFRRMLF